MDGGGVLNSSESVLRLSVKVEVCLTEYEYGLARFPHSNREQFWSDIWTLLNETTFPGMWPLESFCRQVEVTAESGLRLLPGSERRGI